MSRERNDSNGNGNGNGNGRPLHFLSDEEIAARLSMQYRIPTVKLDEYEIERATIDLVPEGPGTHFLSGCESPDTRTS